MNQPVKIKCGMCGNSYNYGHGQYELRKVQGYALWVCTGCWEANWDGWNPRHDADILAHLDREGLPVPPRLANGLFPRQWRQSD